MPVDDDRETSAKFFGYITVRGVFLGASAVLQFRAIILVSVYNKGQDAQ